MLLSTIKNQFKKLFNYEEPKLLPGETEFDYVPLKPKKQFKVKAKITKVEKYLPKIEIHEHEIY